MLSDLLISEGTSSIDPDDLDFNVKIDRGELILPNGNGDGAASRQRLQRQRLLALQEHRERHFAARRPRRARPHLHVAATDEHDEDGTLISDEFTNPHKRRMMVEKRGRKMKAALTEIAPPKLVGPDNAAVTLVGWGSTEGVIREAVEKLAGEEGDRGQSTAVKWIVPFHAEAISRILSQSKRSSSSRTTTAASLRVICARETGFDAARPHPQVRR